LRLRIAAAIVALLCVSLARPIAGASLKWEPPTREDLEYADEPNASLHRSVGPDVYPQATMTLALAQQSARGRSTGRSPARGRVPPEDSAAHDNLGVALMQQGKLEHAIAEFRNAIRLRPDNALAHANLGAALSERGEPDAALRELRTAIKLAPTNATAHFNLGVVLARQGKLDEAIARFRHASRVNPDDPRPHIGLGWDRSGIQCQFRSPGERHPQLLLPLSFPT
jgi:tetratricopeptide (TPR) repeat protein